MTMASGSAASGPWTVARLLQWTREYLAQRDVESPRLCSEILLADALGCERLRLFTQYDSIPEEAVLGRFRASVRRAADGEPVAYLVGRKEFFSLSFTVTPDVLVPRPETEIIVERLVHLVRGGAAVRSVLDIGTGSGCVAIALARHLPDARIHASDISPAALAVAQRNAADHAVADRIDFRTGDLLSPWEDVRAAGGFDVIVSNPPYIPATELAALPPTVRDHEPALALDGGSDGLAVIRRILEESPTYLAGGGHLLMEIGHDQAGLVRDLLAGRSWTDDIATYRDGGGHERVVHVRRSATERTQVA